MIDSQKLLADLQSKASSRNTVVRKLEDDLRKRCDEMPEVNAPLRKEYDEAKLRGRTAMSYSAWRDGELTQIAVAWVLGCVFVRFLEDNELVETPKLSGPGDRLRRARDEHELFFRQRPTDTEREYLQEVFEEVGQLPAMNEFFDKKHNPLWLAAPSGDACRELWQFWQKTDPETGSLFHDFTDHDWNTRFLGDLYQDLSEAARKRYALLQTPEFVEEFILDRTLTPAIETFGYREVRLIDPTCGSGHFLLGAFSRLFRIWRDQEPGENPRILAQRALDGVYGVDLNPFAEAIARFRLLLAALRVCGDVKRLKDAPDFRIHLAVGDSLLHGARFRPFEVQSRRQATFDTEELFKDELAHFFDTEDVAELHRILGQQYHAVVGNPPYITVKDKALNQLYRQRYDACHRRYSLSCPFMERFFDLALRDSGDVCEPAGFTGQITSNSFMKREFGKKLVEKCLPKWDVTHILDTSGAYIPGHGTPTVILFGRNRPPSSTTIRTVMAIKGEPSTPADPAHGLVWSSIISSLDTAGTEDLFVSCSDLSRELFHSHPWSVGGGGAVELKAILDDFETSKLETMVASIGFASFPCCDEVYIMPSIALRRKGIDHSVIRPFVTGESIRDWNTSIADAGLAPYDSNFNLLKFSEVSSWGKHMWPYRSSLAGVISFGGKTRSESGDSWWAWYRWISEKYRSIRPIAYANIATHNHFEIVSEGAVFKQTSPIITFGSEVEDQLRFGLLGTLNSSVSCFWMKQVCQNKGSTVDSRGARQRTDLFEDFYAFDGTKLKQFSVPAGGAPLTLARELHRLAGELAEHSPDTLVARDAVSAAALANSGQAAAELRAQMISLQEELDWQCYRHYGLIDAGDNLEWPKDCLEALPPLTLGERAFEIRMARQMAAGELETTWFERHKDAGSNPITELRASCPDDYRALVERRLACIESNKNINLIERPECKRRWNTEPWAKRQQEGLRKWLLARLEGYFFEGNRICDLGGGFDPSAHSFTPATRPHLVTVNQLADVVQFDSIFLEAAEVYEGASGFSVPKLIRTLVEHESVPYLPVHRYKDSGLRKRKDWETTWELQREEDAVEAKVRAENQGAGEPWLKRLIRKAQEEEVGDIAVPKKYASKDFSKASFWHLRGKLDVPKERWICYPGAERAGDDSLLIAWAGWDHLQQAQALAEYFIDSKDNQGWQAERLSPLLAGLADLVPWLKQWHNQPDPNLGMGLGDYFAGFLEEQCRALELTVVVVDSLRFKDSQLV
jgi:hypothetical protein